ncbi:MAG: hypothetical protein FJ319_12115 [SAR202 cluster bacterium]|nr:hypothetical protein [SAR202 cluster bacterium]
MKTYYAAGKAWHYSHTIGRRTAEHNNGNLGGCAWPADLALSPDGHIFILSRGWEKDNASHNADIYRRVSKTTIDENHIGDFARAEFTWPAGIAVDREGKVYVSDEYEHHIKVFDPSRIMEFPQYERNNEHIARWGVKGTAPGQLNGPSGLQFDANDDLLVVDSLNHRVQKFTKNGRHISSFGSYGAGEGRFNRPWGLTVDAKGDIYVADWGNNRVQKLSPDGRSIMTFGTREDGGELNHPADVAVDSDGDVYVTGWGNNRVQIYEPNGSIIAALYGDADKMSRAAEYSMARNNGLSLVAWQYVDDVLAELQRFERPTGIVIDKQDRIIVADQSGRLQVYAKQKQYAPQLF